MPDVAVAPALFLDFDNTITLGDVLDRVIERFSRTEAWREAEDAWQAGRLSTHECLSRQIGDLRVTLPELREFLADVRLDPAFARIVAWASAHGVELAVLSDNFTPLIRAILDRQGLGEVRVLANELVFQEGRVKALFPFRDPGCPRCAHCKAQHLRASTCRPRIYVGDGLSDVCPARVADVVFAKDSLAADLARRAVPFVPFETLGEVLACLEQRHGGAPRA